MSGRARWAGTRRLGRDVLEMLLPGSCLGCGQRIVLDSWKERVCPRCLGAFRPPPPPLCRRCGLPLGSRPGSDRDCAECRTWPPVLRRARAFAVLEPPADRLVHGLKYGGWRSLGELMGRRMAGVELPGARPGTAGAGGLVVVPVPTTRTRRRRRGYNQAAVLAEAVGEGLSRPVIRALARRPGGRTQVALQPAQRGRNVRRAFTVRSGGDRIRGRHVLLVDDVLTTGATAGAAARALESVGVPRVSLLTFARALPYRGS